MLQGLTNLFQCLDVVGGAIVPPLFHFCSGIFLLVLLLLFADELEDIKVVQDLGSSVQDLVVRIWVNMVRQMSSACCGLPS